MLTHDSTWLFARALIAGSLRSSTLPGLRCSLTLQRLPGQPGLEFRATDTQAGAPYRAVDRQRVANVAPGNLTGVSTWPFALTNFTGPSAA
jgi:hypothetical protein